MYFERLVFLICYSLLELYRSKDSLKQKHYQFGVFSSAALTSREFDRTVFASVK
jgi:hypothetical protein